MCERVTGTMAMPFANMKWIPFSTKEFVSRHNKYVILDFIYFRLFMLFYSILFLRQGLTSLFSNPLGDQNILVLVGEPVLHRLQGPPLPGHLPPSPTELFSVPNTDT